MEVSIESEKFVEVPITGCRSKMNWLAGEQFKSHTKRLILLVLANSKKLKLE